MAISADITQACNDSFRAGLQELYITEVCNITAAAASASDHSFTATSPAYPITTSGDWYKLEPARDMSDWNAEPGEKGSVQITVNCTFEGNEKSKLKKIQDIVNARKVAIIAVTNESAGATPRAHILGYDNIMGNNAYLTANAGAKIEASAFEGANDITLTFTGTQAELPREVVGIIDYNGGTVTLGTAS